MTNESAVEIVRVSKQFASSDRPAVDDVSLSVAPGEFMTLLGPSGSGKTTTLNIIAGFESATTGRVLVEGKDVLSLAPHQRGLGMVFQNYALFPHLTVEANIAFPLQQRKISRTEIRSRVADALRMVGLEGFGRRLPGQLSGGQQQRVALARATVFDPNVLLMDEPLGALDKRLRGQLQQEISRMHRKLGVSVVFVTHDQEEALALSDRIAVYNDGRIEQCGTPEELYRHPASIFVAEFLGESNIFRGTLRTASRNPVIKIGDEAMPVPVSPLADGSSAAVLVRPESIKIVPEQSVSTPSGEASAVIRIEQIVYQGSHRIIEFSSPDGMDGVAGSVRESSGAYSDVHPGQSALARWSLEDAQLFADDRVRTP